jgi:Transposase DDE domain
MANRVAWLSKRVKIGGQWFVRKPIVKPTGFVTEKVEHNGHSVHAPGTFVLEWYEVGKRQRKPLSDSTSEAQDALRKKLQTLEARAHGLTVVEDKGAKGKVSLEAAVREYLAARLGYYDNYLVDNHSCVVVGVQATAARMSQETVAAQDMIIRFVQRQGGKPASIAADTTYGSGEFLQWLLDRGITPYMRTRDSALRKNNPGYGPERFTYQPESNSYRCPAGEQLNYVGLNVRNRAHAYIGSAKRCGACSQKAHCTSGRYKYLAIHIHESARQRARELANTPEFSTAQRQRKKVEALFAELKNQIGLRRLRLRRMKFVREQFYLAAAAQNIKRLVRFLHQPASPVLPATT